MKVAIITGASGSIGRSIVSALGKAGCSVVVNYRSNQRSAEEICHIMQEFGVKAIPFKADCSLPEDVSRMVDFTRNEMGHIDILVNNVGMTRDSLAVRTTPFEFASMVENNLNSAFYCNREVILKSMLQRKSGRIINISSIVGLIGNAGQSSYAATKAGMIGMTKSLAKEYGGRGINVNAVCPGYIESSMTQSLDRDKIVMKIPLQRFGTPDEVAGLVKYLALDDSAAYITGHCFSIDGGLGIGAS